MRCYKIIHPKEGEDRLVTYCMLEVGHKGKCSIHEHANTCHLCKPEKHHATIQELQTHVKEVHRVWKG